MKFRFCGDLDCPDWVLAEISVLSKMTSIKIRLLVSQILRKILSRETDYESIEKLAGDPKFDCSEFKAGVAAISFILKNATRYGVDSETLSNELQQLGLQKDNSNALCKLYNEKIDKLTVCLKESSFRTSRIEKIDWRVDYVLGSSVLKTVEIPSFDFCFITKNICFSFVKANCTISKEKFDTLLTDLKQALKIMESNM